MANYSQSDKLWSFLLCTICEARLGFVLAIVHVASTSSLSTSVPCQADPLGRGIWLYQGASLCIDPYLEKKGSHRSWWLSSSPSHLGHKYKIFSCLNFSSSYHKACRYPWCLLVPTNETWTARRASWTWAVCRSLLSLHLMLEYKMAQLNHIPWRSLDITSHHSRLI